MMTLGLVDSRTWRRAEQNWIAYFRVQDWELYNIHRGGRYDAEEPAKLARRRERNVQRRMLRTLDRDKIASERRLQAEAESRKSRRAERQRKPPPPLKLSTDRTINGERKPLAPPGGKRFEFVDDGDQEGSRLFLRKKVV
jgi:hypothetical protein